MKIDTKKRTKIFKNKTKNNFYLIQKILKNHLMFILIKIQETQYI